MISTIILLGVCQYVFNLGAESYPTKAKQKLLLVAAVSGLVLFFRNIGNTRAG